MPLDQLVRCTWLRHRWVRNMGSRLTTQPPSSCPSVHIAWANAEHVFLENLPVPDLTGSRGGGFMEAKITFAIMLKMQYPNLTICKIAKMLISLMLLINSENYTNVLGKFRISYSYTSIQLHPCCVSKYYIYNGYGVLANEISKKYFGYESWKSTRPNFILPRVLSYYLWHFLRWKSSALYQLSFSSFSPIIIGHKEALSWGDWGGQTLPMDRNLLEAVLNKLLAFNTRSQFKILENVSGNAFFEIV